LPPHADTYLLSRSEAAEIIDSKLEVINTQYREAADAVRLTSVTRNGPPGTPDDG
jgi:hypothetical protein